MAPPDREDVEAVGACVGAAGFGDGIPAAGATEGVAAAGAAVTGAGAPEGVAAAGAVVAGAGAAVVGAATGAPVGAAAGAVVATTGAFVAVPAAEGADVDVTGADVGAEVAVATGADVGAPVAVAAGAADGANVAGALVGPPLHEHALAFSTYSCTTGHCRTLNCPATPRSSKAPHVVFVCVSGSTIGSSRAPTVPPVPQMLQGGFDCADADRTAVRAITASNRKGRGDRHCCACTLWIMAWFVSLRRISSLPEPSSCGRGVGNSTTGRRRRLDLIWQVPKELAETDSRSQQQGQRQRGYVGSLVVWRFIHCQHQPGRRRRRGFSPRLPFFVLVAPPLLLEGGEVSIRDGHVLWFRFLNAKMS
jgi:hypothetical protein